MGRRNLTPLGLATLVTVVTGAGLLVFRTPLMVAAQQGRDDLVKLLVDHGASPAARCAGGTAHDLALRAGHPGTAALLTP